MRMIPFVLLVACGQDGKPTDSAAPQTSWYRDVKPIVDGRCAGCHVAGGIGPFPLDTYAAASAMSTAMASAVSAGRMPPWPPDAACNEYRSDRSLSAEQIATIVAWADEGAPEGVAAEEGAPLTAIEGMSRVDVTLTMEEAYTPAIEPDDYRCFLLEWTGGDAFVTGFSATPGNRSVVHHVIAYGVPGSDAAAYEAMDAAEEGPGYTCFGGPGGDEGGKAAWLGGWVPGSTGSDFPEGTGIPMAEGDLIAIQIHYNTATVGPQPDQTAIDIKVDADVDKQAAIVKVFDPRWLVPGGMTLAAGDADATYSYTYTNETAQTFSLWSAGLHMHQLGVSTSLTLDQAAGEDDCLLEIPNWRFGWQGTYFFQEAVEFAPGDAATLTCHWDNSAIGAVDTEWGEGSADEMCLGMVYGTLAD